MQEGFTELVQQKWEEASNRHPEKAYSIDKWHENLCKLRQFLKGWGANLRGDYKRTKSNLLLQIQKLDEKILHNNTDTPLLRDQYTLEQELEKLMEIEELYWQKRGGENWVTKGDANCNRSVQIKPA